MDKKSQTCHVGHQFYQAQEEILELKCQSKKLEIGIPCEKYRGENRICITPQSVKVLADHGHRIVMEQGAGQASNYTDMQYSESGAILVKEKKEVYQCDLVLQVSSLSAEEIDLLRGNQFLFSALRIQNQSSENIKKLMQKKVTAMALDLLKDRDGSYPIIRSMSEIAGISSIMIAGEYLSKQHQGKGVILGGITGISPAEIVILGAGTVAEYASKAALGLGAMVKVFDDSIYRLRRLENRLKHRLFTSIFHPHVLAKAISSADLVIGAMHFGKNQNKQKISENVVKQMKQGSVIVDLSIDEGGCFESSKPTTHNNPVYKLHGVLHYCVPNVPSRFCRTASLALSNICTPLLLNIGHNGGVCELLKNDNEFRDAAYVYRGILTNRVLGDILGMQSKEIDFLLAAM